MTQKPKLQLYTVTTASKHDSIAMSTINHKPNAHYIFNRAYDSFKELYQIHLIDQYRRECSSNTDKHYYNRLFGVIIVQYDMPLNHSSYEACRFSISH